MDLIQEMGIKDLEHVVLKAKDYMSLGGRVFEPGEPVLYFRNIQIALLSEDTRTIAARGGFLNQPRVVWEDRSETTFQFSNGTLNPLSFNLLLESNMAKQVNSSIPYQKVLDYELNDEGQAVIILPKEPDMTRPRFYYTFAAENLQKRVKPISEEGRKIILDWMPDTYANDFQVMVDYYYKPKISTITYTMDRERKANLYSLEATFYLKDENDGLLHTGILEMPKVYIMSNINLRMGERADPTVGTFRIVAMPENYDSYESMVWRVTYLDEDIYGI